MEIHTNILIINFSSLKKMLLLQQRKIFQKLLSCVFTLELLVIYISLQQQFCICGQKQNACGVNDPWLHLIRPLQPFWCCGNEEGWGQALLKAGEIKP